MSCDGSVVVLGQIVNEVRHIEFGVMMYLMMMFLVAVLLVAVFLVSMFLVPFLVTMFLVSVLLVPFAPFMVAFLSVVLSMFVLLWVSGFEGVVVLVVLIVFVLEVLVQDVGHIEVDIIIVIFPLECLDIGPSTDVDNTGLGTGVSPRKIAHMGLEDSVRKSWSFCFDRLVALHNIAA